MAESPIDAYLADVPEEMRAALIDLRATIAASAPEASETISYQMPTFKYKGLSLVGFAAFKNHCSLFPMSVQVIDDLEPNIAAFRTSKGTLRFTPNKPIPQKIVKKIVAARVKELDERKKSQ